MIGLSTLVENVFPPTPSDLLVTLGGFLSHHSDVSPEAVFLVAWLTNFAGTVLLYGVARRWGRGFLDSRTGRRLLTPGSIAAMEREYLRFGPLGIGLGRLIPGFRTFVAPFAGLANLSPITALVPLAIASALWYGMLTFVGAAVGQEWNQIVRFLEGLNRTLAVVAVVAAVALGIYLIRRPTPRPRYERMLGIIHRALGADPDQGPETGGDPSTAAAAMLMYELARADLTLNSAERQLIENHFRQKWEVGAGRDASATGPPEMGMDDTREVAVAVADQFGRERRLALVERLWRIAAGDGTLSLHEERLMRRAGELLGLTPEDLAATRRRAQP